MDTIFAQATARGKAGVSIVRLSGPDAFATARRFVGGLPEPRKTGLRRFVDPEGNLVDQALVVCFASGHSFTGEDVVEFHLHGSPAVLSKVLSCLTAVPGCRLADAGEFTRRALENDVLDLSEVEGLGDLIEAETEAQRRQAVRVFSGALGRVVEDWRSDLIRAAALLEATIDFVDEEVPTDVRPEVRRLLTGVLAEVGRQSAGYRAAERIRDGFEVALVGETNVGKSTLLNRLAGREAAITSEAAGTTRDVIEVRMDIGGLPVTLLDTAGVREAGDAVERIGISRTFERAMHADLRVFLLADPADRPAMEPRADDIVVVGKADLSASRGVSGKTGQGVDELLARIGAILEHRAGNAGLAISLRHKTALDNALVMLQDATARLEDDLAEEIVAEDLRGAIRSLDSLVGRVDVEHLLDEIFSRFCIGK